MTDLSPLDRHEKIALFYSGGKDSRACVELLKEHLDRIVIYHNDTGDLLPEVRECVAEVEAWAPHFVRITTDVKAWIAEHGLPTDLLPYGNHPVGYMLGHAHAKLVSRYDCCYINLMWPQFQRAHDDGCTLIIRGTKRVDMPRMAAENGEVGFGMELWLPLHDWTDEQVFAYLALRGVKLPRIYEHTTQGPDCARCSAWWSEGRRDYLKEYHPELWAEYDARLQVIIDAIAPSLAMLRREAGVV